MTGRLLRQFARLGAIVLVMAANIVPAAAGSSEKWEVQGVTYVNVRVGEVTGGTVTIFHRGGITQLELAKLPTELQTRFGFDPAKAQDWRANAEAQLASTAETKRRTAEQRDAAGRVAARSGSNGAPVPSDVTGPVELRPSVDLRPIYARHRLYLRDQGRRPSCSVFAVVSALEYEIARQRGTADPLSEDYLIWATRRLHADVNIDDGFHFEEVLSALQSSGVPRQRTMPNTFGKSMEKIEPTDEALAEATLMRGVVPIWIRAGEAYVMQRIITRLNQETPVVLGLRWPHWRALEHTALLSDQEPLEGAGHAVTLVGYRCPEGTPESVMFLFRNSWGNRWGTGGCGFVTAAYLQRHIIAAFYLTLPDGAPTVASLQ